MKSKRNKFLMISLTLLLFLLSACTNQSSTEKASGDKSGNTTIHIGYQKFGSLNFLKAKGTLEKKLEPLGY
ncbi:MAG: transporter substrate-binding protein, partial [Neobacillus sp.]|nr:transporter substrate-binding protein [Neobacillus sp.]